MRIASTFLDRRIAAGCAGALCLLTLLHAAFSAKTIGHLSPDSWTSFELSKSVFHGFYRVATVRQFAFEPPYGASMPPLLPSLAAIWNSVAHSGVYAGAWIGLIAALLTCPLLVLLGRRLAASDGPGILAAAALLGNPWYLDEVMGGGATPLVILLFAVLLLLLHRALETSARPERIAAAAGLVAGLVFEARFDFLLPAIAIGAALSAGRTREGSRLTAAYAAGLAAAVAPWVAYSAFRFHVPLASDGVRAAFAVGPLVPLRFVPFPETIATLRDAPFEWIAAKIWHSWPTLEAVAIAIGTSPIPALAAMWAATREGAQDLPHDSAIVLVLAWLALAVQISVALTTGEPDVRHWIAIAVLGTFTIAAALCNGSEIPHVGPAAFILFLPAQVALLGAVRHAPGRLAGVLSFVWPLAIVTFVVLERPLRGSRALARLGMAAAILVPLVSLGAGSLIASDAVGSRYSLRADATARTLPASARIVEGLDGADPARARILLAGAAPIDGEFGARTGLANVLKPAAPFGWLDLWLLVRRYGITHATAGDPEIDARLPVLFAVHRSANGALWIIDGPRQGLVVIDEAHPAGSILGLNTMLLVTNAGPVDAMPARRREPEEWSYPLLLVPR